MPTIRPEIARIKPYQPGRRIEEVARDVGLRPDEIIKLASNESPGGPFPGVVEVIAEIAPSSNRYPDNDLYDLSMAVSAASGLAVENLWFGAGSTALIGHIAQSVGGSGTSAVYAWPSFIMYRIASQWAMAEAIEVPLGDGYLHDTSAMADAVRDDTTIVYVCNPNNPTGTVVSADQVSDLIEALPDRILIVVDEAYHDFVDDPGYRSAIPLATSRPNVVVLRTFSKIYSLAAHRVGFAIGMPETLTELKKSQPPFSVTQVGQAAAAISVGNRDEVRRRAEVNAVGRQLLLGVLRERGLAAPPSQTNFVFTKLGDDSRVAFDCFVENGVIIRPMSRGWIRVTVGTEEENQRFVAALHEVLRSIKT